MTQATTLNFPSPLHYRITRNKKTTFDVRVGNNDTDNK